MLRKYLNKIKNQALRNFVFHNISRFVDAVILDLLDYGGLTASFKVIFPIFPTMQYAINKNLSIYFLFPERRTEDFKISAIFCKYFGGVS